MKKFFKALALVLALTLVFGTIPASAAVNPDKVRKEKTLYVDGTKGKTADGVESQLKARTTYWRLLKIKKAEAKELGVTATSADPEVIKTNDESMGVRAYAIGGSKEKPIVITLNDGTNLYKVNMIAKKSADTVVFGRDFADADKEYSINTTYELSLPRTVNGVKLDTDERRLIVKDADGNVAAAEVVEVKEDAAKPRLWTVKFLKAGKYTLVGEAFQSKKYDGTTKAFELEITVTTPELQDIVQTATNAFQLSFSGDASAIDFKPQEIYYKVDGNVVPFSLLKEVKVNADDPTKVDVTMHMDFKGGETYYVKVGEVIKSFVACGTSAKDITKLVIVTEKVEYGQLQNIDYKYYNDAEIDITGPNKDLEPTFEITSNNTSDAYISTTNIYFFEKDKTVAIKGTVTTDYGNEANSYTPSVVEGVGTITSTDQAQAEFHDIVYTFSNTAMTAADAKDFDWDNKAVHDYKINDAANILNIFFRYDSADRKSLDYRTLQDAEITKVAVADENFAVITGLDKNSYVTVKGIKAITSVPVIFYTANAVGEDEPIRTINIQIQDARALKKATLSMENNKSRLNLESSVDDKVVIVLKTIDNYNEAIDIDLSKTELTQTDVTIKNVGTLTIGNFTREDTGVYTFAVTSGAFEFIPAIKGDATKEAKGGSVVVNAKTELNGVKATSNNLGFDVADKTNATVSYMPKLSSATLDTSLKEDTKESTSVFTVEKMKAGYYAGEEPVAFLSKTDRDKNTVTIAANKDKFYYTIKLGNELIDKATNFDATKNKITAIAKSSEELKISDDADGVVTDSAIKAQAGTYVYTLYRVVEVSTGKYELKSYGTANLVVSDAQELPKFTVATDVTVEKGSDESKNLKANAAVAKEGLKVTCFGKAYNDNIVAADIVKSNIDSDYMKTITVRINNNNGLGALYVKIDVLKLFNGTNK